MATTLSSPYVVNHDDRVCTKEKCAPFYVREWETMLVGTLIVSILIYLTYSCPSEYFGVANRANTQRDFAVLSTPDHDSTRIMTFAAAPRRKPSMHGTVQRGASRESTGVATEKFVEFAAVDAIDGLATGEPEPTHQPETTDDDLADQVY